MTMIKARISPDIRAFVDKELEEKQISESEFLRQIISEHFSQSEEKRELITSPSKSCIWPNIRKWSKDDESGEWSSEDYQCPIRLEKPAVTADELSRLHCKSCPIRKDHEQRRRSKRYRSSEPRVGRPMSERYPNLYRGSGANWSDAFGWSHPGWQPRS